MELITTLLGVNKGHYEVAQLVAPKTVTPGPNTPTPWGTIQDNIVLAIWRHLQVLVLAPSTLHEIDDGQRKLLHLDVSGCGASN